MNEISAIGVMSGSSLDGLDICYCDFKYIKSKWQFQNLRGETIPFPKDIYSQLINVGVFSGRKLAELDVILGIWIGQMIRIFCQRHQYQPHIIGSHGHTVFHDPKGGYSIQIGSGQAIASYAKIPTINDFRSKDVLLGGAGAPLVPIGDKHLFSDYDVCINLGGIANLTINCEGSPRAFDVTPCNQILNKIANLMGLAFDQDGKMASSGNLLKSWYASLRTPNFYQKKGPKSISNEWVEQEVLSKLPEQENPKDLAFTFCKFVGDQIAESLSETAFNTVLLSGGGVYNKTLIRSIEKALGVKVVVPKKEIINFKEALIFSFMAVLKLRKEVNVLKSVTGAVKNTSSGVYYSP
tara:strand:- start:435 stop:1490 length:1056 start_codon:yes stop_codon:yes gene_type:complete